MDIINKINNDEGIESTYNYSKKAYIKNCILENLLYIFLWVAFDVFFVYMMLIESVKTEFWFVILPVGGFNLLTIWLLSFIIIKNITRKKNTGCILTDKAIYLFNKGTYKELKRIGFDEVVVLEKSDYICDGFYVASKTNHIHVKNITNEKELFEKLVEKIKN